MFLFSGVKPYKCARCDKAFTQRCSLESHSKKVHGLEYAYDYKERRNKVYVCEECGHSTGDPEDHFRHLQQNHPFCPALARCHDKRQFKFQTPENVDKCRKTAATLDATESGVRIGHEQNTHLKPNATGTSFCENKTETAKNKTDAIEMRDHGFNKDSSTRFGSSNAEKNSYDNELCVAVQSVQEQINHMEGRLTVENATNVAVENQENDKLIRVEDNILNKEIVIRGKVNTSSPRKFPWKSPRKSPRKFGQSPQKSKINRPLARSGQSPGEPFKIYQDVPQYDIENRSIQKLKQYGGDDYYKSKQAGSPLGARESRENQSTGGTLKPKQFNTQDNRTSSLKQPLGSLTQNTQHLK